ncbi:DMT family transporter [Paenibacillus sp. PAMC21692]|uniref:DMT family transporter n=1 Tax=Paenibacillus sp. PAMC21692 TaxID=2762320 RepID=UPI00164DB12B|nr:DMT family transporter [Paenibacillus sp. PAMC21692]QNK55036.1 EamA family transporter [Paenibacillus sp. PAMC21692]
MFWIAMSLVIISGTMNAIWNFFAKRSESKQAYLALIVMTANVILIPILLMELLSERYPPQVYLLLLLSMAAQAAYAFMLSQVYKLGDLSQVYPIQRGTGVLLIPLISVIFMGERLSIGGWAGVAIILLGILGLSEWNKRSNPGQAVQLIPVLTALGVGLCTTSYVLIDKMTLQYVTPLTLIAASNIGFMLGNVRTMVNGKTLLSEWRKNKGMILLGSVLMPGSYFLFLMAMNLAPVSHIAPIREIGTVVATLLGIWILKEKNGIRRLMTATAITAGIIVVGISG